MGRIEVSNGGQNGRAGIGLAVVAALLTLGGCGTAGPPPDVLGPLDGGLAPIRCGEGDDPDDDFISSIDEGPADFDNDGSRNPLDSDADGDGIGDAIEAGDADCYTEPVDTDGDGNPDFLDLDSNGDGTLDRDQASGNAFRVRDNDADGIPNWAEFGDGSSPVDSDADGLPDLADEDSDGDTVLDKDEGARDTDRDGTPNFRDLDSDGDGIVDAVEAVDADPLTPPLRCASEVDPVTGEIDPDPYPDFLDVDSDNDGLADGQEVTLGADPCDADTDDDGLNDLAEGVYQQVNCPDGATGTDCDCVRNAACGIPAEHFFVVLPYGGEPVERDLEFGTTIQAADVFFLADTTSSMGGVVANVKSTVTTPVTGLIDRIRATIPQAWFGGGQHDDFSFSPYGSYSDVVFRLAIGMSGPSQAADVQAAFHAIGMHSGGDSPESQVEALFQIMTGEGGSWTSGSSATAAVPRYSDACLEGRWGAPCFRQSAMPIIVHFTDVCAHNGPPGESGLCADYAGIAPDPRTWEETVAELNRRGAKYVGVNSSGTLCGGGTGPNGSTPCFFMRRTAEETASVDMDGRPLVYNLSESGGTASVFTETIVSAIRTIATSVPMDVDTATRDDAGDAEGLDAREFIKRRQPACGLSNATEACWVAPTGMAEDQAVAAHDTSTFFGVLPGTRVRFRITFQNDFRPGDSQAALFVAFIDVRGGGSAVLDTRQVYVVVPASTGAPIE